MSNARPPLQSGYTYHIFNQGNNKEDLFKEPRNYAYFLEKYKKTIHPIVDTFTFCLLPNHFHLLVRIKPYIELHKAFPDRFPKPITNITTTSEIATIQEIEFDKHISFLLSRQFGGWFSGYTRAINKAYDRKGKLLSLPFERILVSNETYFTYLIAYIHRNPIHHHFCSKFEDWHYSSYFSILSFLQNAQQQQKRTVRTLSSNSSSGHPDFVKASSGIINFPFLLNWFETSANFQKTHQESLDFLDRELFLE